MLCGSEAREPPLLSLCSRSCEPQPGVTSLSYRSLHTLEPVLPNRSHCSEKPLYLNWRGASTLHN